MGKRSVAGLCKFLIQLSWLLSLCASPAISRYAYAQTLSEEQLSQLPPEVAEQLRKVSVKDLLNGKVKTRTPFLELSERDPEWVTPLPITLHLRGDGGSPLPTPEDLRKEREKTRVDLEPYTRAAQEFLFKAAEEFQQSAQPPPTPKSCTSSAKNLRSFDESFGEGVLLDILFIRKEDLPHDTNEAFGSGVQIVSYGDTVPLSWAHFASLQNVQCLPTRIRLLGSGVAELSGEFALRNYSSSSDGELIGSMAAKAQAYRR